MLLCSLRNFTTLKLELLFCYLTLACNFHVWDMRFAQDLSLMGCYTMLLSN